MLERKPRRPEPEDLDDEDEAPVRKSRRAERDDDEDDAPVKKKKKKQKPQAPAKWPKIAGFAAIGVVGVAFAVVIIWTVISLAGGGPPAQPVAAFAKFNTDGQEWGFDYSRGWQAAGYGLPGKREAEIKGNAATITVKENLAGSLVGDIARASDGGREVDDEFSPVAKVHELRKPKDSKTYKEEPAVTVMTRFGKARRSAYTDGSRKGYRATVLLNQTALDVFCDCRASDWDVLRPAFERSIESLGAGGP